MVETGDWRIEMAKLVVSQFITVDGVVEDPGGSEKFERGGWAFQFDRGPEGDKFKLDEVMASDALLLGRTTYEGFAEAWPSREGEFADKFNGMRKYVVSSTLSDPDWNNTQVLSPGELAGEVERIKGEHDGDILVNGSVQVVDALTDHGLVDEYRLMVFPLVLGKGKRMFADTSEPRPLKLTSSKQAGETLIQIFEPSL
jgi:dihydrofolate reductase